MREQSSTKSLVESGLLTAVTVVLILISLYVPVFYIVGIFLWPLPITFIYMRHGAKYSVVSLVAAGIITAMMYDPVSALSMSATFGVMSIVFGYCIKNKKTFSFSIAVMTAVMFISMVLVIKVFSLFMGQDLLSFMSNQMIQMQNMMKQIYSSMGVPKETQDMVLKSLPTAEMFKLLLPVLLLLTSVIMAFFSYVAANKVFAKFGYKLNKMKPLSEWFMPIQLAIAIIGLVLAAFIMVYFKVKNADVLYINANILFQFAFLINGLGAIDFFMKKKEIGKTLRVVIIIFLLISQLGNLLYLVGIVDYAFNLRKLDTTRNGII